MSETQIREASGQPIVGEDGLPENYPLWCPTCGRTTWYDPREVPKMPECCRLELDMLRSEYAHPENPATEWWRALFAAGQRQVSEQAEKRAELHIERQRQAALHEWRSKVRARVLVLVVCSALTGWLGYIAGS